MPSGMRRGEPLDAGGGLGIEHVGRFQDLVHDHGLPRQDVGNRLLIPAQAPPLAQRPERRHVVEAKVLLVVLVALERHAVLAQDGLIRPQMKRLGVGEDAVEVEDDGPDLSHQRSPLAGLDRHRQPVLARWNRALVLGIEDAERVIGPVEIELVDAAAPQIQIEVAAALIGLEAVREIAERHEQPPQRGIVGLGERGERMRLSLERERERADPAHAPRLAGRRGHLDDVVAADDFQACGNVVLLVDRVVRQRLECRALGRQDRRVRRSHVGVALGSPGGNLVGIAGRRTAARRGGGESSGQRRMLRGNAPRKDTFGARPAQPGWCAGGQRCSRGRLSSAAGAPR